MWIGASQYPVISWCLCCKQLSRRGSSVEFHGTKTLVYIEGWRSRNHSWIHHDSFDDRTLRTRHSCLVPLSPALQFPSGVSSTSQNLKWNEVAQSIHIDSHISLPSAAVSNNQLGVCSQAIAAVASALQADVWRSSTEVMDPCSSLRCDGCWSSTASSLSSSTFTKDMSCGNGSR